MFEEIDTVIARLLCGGLLILLYLLGLKAVLENVVNNGYKVFRDLLVDVFEMLKLDNLLCVFQKKHSFFSL